MEKCLDSSIENRHFFFFFPYKNGCFAKWYRRRHSCLLLAHFIPLHFQIRSTTCEVTQRYGMMVSDHYSLENTGFRFSRKALMASFRSFDLIIPAFHVATCSRPCSMVASLLLSRTALVPITAHADLSAISEIVSHRFSPGQEHDRQILFTHEWAQDSLQFNVADEVRKNTRRSIILAWWNNRYTPTS